MTELHALWVTQLKTRYFKRNSAFRAKIPSSSSWMWKCIYRGIILVEQNNIWEICDGMKVNIWEDNWIPDVSEKLKQYKTSNNSSVNLVRDLIDTDTKRWNATLIHSLFPRDIAQKICNIRFAKEDTLRWLLTRSGKFTMKSMYDKLNEKTINYYNLGQPDTFWKKLWATQTSQRIKKFAWKCLQDVVSTNVKLSRFKDISSSCSFGCNEQETIEYLFLHCKFAQAVWATDPHPVDIHFNRNTTFFNIFEESPEEGNPQIPIEIIMTKIWFICKERCNRAFDNQQQTHQQVAVEIQRHLAYLHKEKYTVKIKDLIRGNTSNNTWKLPEPHYHKLNLDDAWISCNTPAGFAIIFRNDVGEFIQGRAGPISATEPEEEEALGYLQAAKWARPNNLSTFSVEGDCKNLVDYLNGEPSQISWQNQTIMDEAKNEFSFCNNFKVFYFVHRTANNVADTFAKEARSFRIVVNWDTVPPSCIQYALEVDKSNARVSTINQVLDGSTRGDVRVTNSQRKAIHDNIIVSHEIIHTVKHKEGFSGTMALKLDLSKAFDKLECSVTSPNPNNGSTSNSGGTPETDPTSDNDTGSTTPPETNIRSNPLFGRSPEEI
ncbi:uncharacterized protein LOC113295515 [Papaver somniferum]|uniref:uncharacterized protein LOC113295515 n=1 Tax=Papaver somniferum TaxID=3469 RepID=UPI000E6F6A7E|nr:uncharacterized protein LOC113295515 [Papaver somniferum]